MGACRYVWRCAPRTCVSQPGGRHLPARQLRLLGLTDISFSRPALVFLAATPSPSSLRHPSRPAAIPARSRSSQPSHPAPAIAENVETCLAAEPRSTLPASATAPAPATWPTSSNGMSSESASPSPRSSPASSCIACIEPVHLPPPSPPATSRQAAHRATTGRVLPFLPLRGRPSPSLLALFASSRVAAISNAHPKVRTSCPLRHSSSALRFEQTVCILCSTLFHMELG